MKKKFDIVQEGTKARISIIGNIRNWQNSAEDFNNKLNAIRQNGVVDVEVYINSFGGSVFEANEISNIIISFEGTVKFTIGAVCASAATIILAQVITQKENVTIEMYRNGQFMIHNVSGNLEGQIKDIESGLVLMRNLQQNAVNAYVAQTGISEKQIIAMMDKETWLTASEAVAKKFITAVIDKSDAAPENFADIQNCGYQNLPENFKSNKIINNQIQEKMNLEQINKATGKNFTNEADAIEYIAELEAENKRISAEKKQAEIAAKNQEIENMLTKAVEEKRILPSQKDSYKSLLESSFEATKKLISELQPVNLISKEIKQTGNGNQPTQKSYRELIATEPETLNEMFKSDFDQFNKLYKAEYGRDFKKIN